jgi:hypothetical protein
VDRHAVGGIRDRFFVGMIGSGAIMAAMGFASLINVRDLKTELSEINLFGGG